uniref:Uncharacterized protein n=1 Tax=Arundo donax TaxID=35708 RepID=A0A0A9FAJ3_ARUDO
MKVGYALVRMPNSTTFYLYTKSLTAK